MLVLAFVFALTLVLALAEMLALIMAFMITAFLYRMGCGCLHRSHLNRWRILAAHGRTSSAANCRTQDRTIYSTELVANRRTRCPADCAAHYCTTIHRINIHAGGKQ